MTVVHLCWTQNLCVRTSFSPKGSEDLRMWAAHLAVNASSKHPTSPPRLVDSVQRAQFFVKERVSSSSEESDKPLDQDTFVLVGGGDDDADDADACSVCDGERGIEALVDLSLIHI